MQRRPLTQWIAAALAMGAMQAHAAAPPLSQAWLAQSQQNPAAAAANPTPGNAASGLSALTPQVSGQLLQQRVVQQSIANLTSAAQAVAAQISAQQAAQRAAQAQTTPVPDGLTPGGLQVAAGVASDPSLWQNANAPVSSNTNGHTTVQVKQTAQKAILTWDSFNVGRNTTLYFNQSGGTQNDGSNNWIALNRIVDPTGVPSQIFGQIKAEGTVYLLNRNGILFGAGSQVNTGSFLASSLYLFNSDVTASNNTFLSSGIAASSTGTQQGFLTGGVFNDGKNHDVVIQQGASITTGAQGFTLIAAPNVSNAGSIIADDGQAILAATTKLSNAATNGSLQVYNDTYLGVSQQNYLLNAGTVTNTGLVQARRGQVHLLGDNVDQAGVALASTSISHPGSIELRAQDGGSGNNSFARSGALTLAPGSVTAVLPEEDGTTTSSTPAANQAFVGSSLTLAGGTVNFQQGSLLEAPGATLNVSAQIDAPGAGIALPATAGRIYVDDGSILDVSGLANVVLPMSALLVTIPRIGQNELADSPLLRNGFLYTQKDVVVDSSQSGTLPDGLNWIGSPILNVAGYVENVPRDISQMLTKGGSIGLNGTEVIVRSGAQLNLDGGYIAYQPGWITTPNLLGADGAIYNIASADPNMTYVGFAGQYTDTHSRWGVSETYTTPLMAGMQRWDPGFIVGSDAGSLNIQVNGALVLDGAISAQSFAGRNQVAQGQQPSNGQLSVAPLPTTYGFTSQYGYAQGILLQQSSLVLEDLAPGFNADTPWDVVLKAQDATATPEDNLRNWLTLSADTIEQSGFGSVNVQSSAILEPLGTSLAVQPGGSIALTGSNITVLGSLSAPSGKINLTTTAPALLPAGSAAADDNANITIGSNATLSTRGLWINDSGQTADSSIGDRYVNGGSISLTTQQAYLGNPDNGVDGTGSILLQPGSLLDVSGGGYVDPSGQVRTSMGMPIGQGGDISLLTYAGQNFGVNANSPTSLDSGRIELGGELHGYGFSGGGTLSLQAAQIQIGGDPSAMALKNGLYLPASFFAGQGFDNYALTAVTDASIAAGTTVNVQRANLLPNDAALQTAPSGTDLYASDAANPQGIYASVGLLDPYHRWAGRDTTAGHGPGFSLNAGAYLDWNRLASTVSSGAPQYAGVSGSLLLGQGASIVADAGAAVSLSGTQATTVLGTVTAPGGAIAITVGSALKSRQSGLPTVTPYVWLGSQAVLDASGVSLVDPWVTAVSGSAGGGTIPAGFIPRTGDVLAGGSVSLSGYGGYVLAQQGSQIDVSGAADTYDLPVATSTLGASSVGYVATPVWSDAGSIAFNASAGLYADATLQAHGGAAQAEGGSLSIVGLVGSPAAQQNAKGLLLQQSGELLPAGLQPGGSVESGGPSGILHFAADRLDGSGISSLNLGAPTTSTDSTQGVLPLGFAGDVKLSLAKSFTANASSYIDLPAGSTGLSTAGGYAQGTGTVSIDAPYVNLSGTLQNTSAPVALAGDGALRVNADFIDLGGWLNLQQWGSADFTSSGDLRFYLPPTYAYSNGAALPGLLFTTGDLTFKAAQLYPVSDYHFVIDANASGLADAQGQALSTTVSILPNGSSTAPLSAGGGLLISADHIEQEGTIRVPSGTLVLGVKDPAAQAAAFGLNPALFPLATTQSVHLAAGSMTSVSLDNATVPYGTTIDGVEWRYNGDPLNDSNDLTAPPSKQLSINGVDLALDKGAGVDLSGGGELQAEEWVSGTGGSRDVLSQYGTSYTQSSTGTQVPQYADGRAIYAILPGYQAPLAAQDAALEKGAGAGPAVGQAVYLAGAPGLPAGMYTLLPAKYATLPGAYRVVQDTSAIDSVPGNSVVQPDGTLSVTGYFADALSGARSARNTTFLLQSGPVWQQYSQYTISNADTFFANLASKAGTVAPSLPADAGQLVLAAGQQLNLGASLTATPGTGGRSSQVDIAAQAIQILGDGEAARSGYLTLSADGLTALNAGSLLIGGTRSLTASGEQIDSVADSVVLSNDSAHPLAGQEIMLVADGSTTPGAQGVLLESGSSIQASGSSNAADSQPIVFGQNPGTDASGKPIAAISGDGAMLRVSQNGTATVTRNQVPGSGGVAGTPAGQLTIEAGANIQGGNALTLDATGTTLVDPSAVFDAKVIDASSSQITFTGEGTNPQASGLVIGPQTLNLFRNAQQVILRSRGSIDFLGNLNIDLANTLELDAGALVSDGGQVDIQAGQLGLGNALGATKPAFALGSGSLALHAGEIDFGAGNTTLQGFGSFSATASSGMAGQGSGGVDFGSLNVNLATPVLLAESGANTSLSTTGSFNLSNGGGTALQRDAMGGSLSLSGGSLSIATSVQAIAGNLNLTASSGDLHVASGANLDAAGANKTFFDTVAYAPGGALALAASHGNVVVDAGSTLNFSGAAQGGDAGSLSVTAADQVQLNGLLQGQANSGYRGGYFSLNSGSAVDLDNIAALANAAGATGLVDVSSGVGNLTLSSGHTLTAQKVYLSANGGSAGPSASDGNVLIDGTINAAAASGSQIQLYGNSGVDVEGSLIATSSIPAQRGGNVTIGTSGVGDGSLNAAYGYENVQSAQSGRIHLGANARIDVSGGSADNFSGGQVSLRAPLLADGDVQIAIDGGGSSIVGARAVTVEPYAVWSTADASTDASKHFDGVIDPAGWYQDGGSGKPAMVAGTWTDATGKILAAPTSDAQLKQYLGVDYFMPTQANADHQGFYGYVDGDASKGPGALMGYVEQPGFAFGDRYAGIANLSVRPGIELRSPADGPAGGDISVLTNWNLGAGTTASDGSITLAYRYQGLAPILTVRAANNLDIEASITDGFYQQNSGATLANPPVPPPPPPPVGDNGYAQAYTDYQTSQQYLDSNGLWNGTINLYVGGTADISKDPYYQPLQAPLQGQTANYYTNYDKYIGEIGDGNNQAWAYAFATWNNPAVWGFNTYSPTTLVAPQPGAYGNYSDYITAYQNWLTTNFNAAMYGPQGQPSTPSPLLLPIDADYGKYTSDYAEYIVGHANYYQYVFNIAGSGLNGGELFYAPFAPAANPVNDNPAYDKALAAYQTSQEYLDSNGLWNGTINLYVGGTADISKDPYYQPLQAPLKGQSANYYANYDQYIGEVGDGNNQAWAYAFATWNNPTVWGFNTYSPTTLVAPQPGAYDTYGNYVSAYQNWLTTNFNASMYGPSGQPSTPSPLLLPIDTDYGKYTSDYAEYITGHANYYQYVFNIAGSGLNGGELFYAPFAPASNAAPSGGGGGTPPTSVPVPASAANNSPSNMPSLGSPASLASATLLGGSSTSYRLVAGADLDVGDPLALSATSTGTVSLDGHFAVTDTLTDPSVVTPNSPYAGKTLLLPTTVRTGTGSIDIAAAGDIDWLDSAAPATVYTAGEPTSGTTAGTGVSVLRPSEVAGSLDPTAPDMLVTGLVNPTHAGDISLTAQSGINGIEQVYDSTGNVTKGTAGGSIAQFWWPWMQTGNAADGSSSSINFGNFDQGVMSVGGNVAVSAGGDIRELSVSLPTTWIASSDRSSVTTVGGGNLNVQAGGDILSGSYFVANGQGNIAAGGNIDADFSYAPSGTTGVTTTPVSTLLAMQDAQVAVSARQGVNLGGVFDPSYYTNASVNSILPARHFDAQGYGNASSLSVSTVDGDLSFGSLQTPGQLFNFGGTAGVAGPVLPASLNLSALSGDIHVLGSGELYPSPTGNLNMLADGSIDFSQQTAGDSNAESFGLIDLSPAAMPSPLQPSSLGEFLGAGSTDTNSFQYHMQDPLHGDDSTPVRIYALNGDIIDGTTAPNGFNYLSLAIMPSKPALIYAGRDIVNLDFIGQQTHAADITRISAGRDIYDTPYLANYPWTNDFINGYELAPALLLGGPGSFLVEAGRNIGPLTSQAETSKSNQAIPLTGIDSVGNLFNDYLPHEGANVNVAFGVGPGMAVADFITQYLDPANGVDGVGSLVPDLVGFMDQRVAGQVVDTGYAKDKLSVNLTPQQARALFDQQPEYVQRLFVEQELFKILATVGNDYNDASSKYYHQYARGYAAISTLFPASLGYTANGGQGGENGSTKPVDTGDLDIRSSTIQTQQGGNISILGPGGQALLGSASAPPVIVGPNGTVVAGPNTMGVLTLEQGSVDMFTDRSVLLAQSRIFTEQGGDLVMWSSNGDINAGQGAKTTAEIPPPTYLCTYDAWCRIDARGEVSGAGIATLQTVQGAPGGSVYLIAPRGTVDAGDAGIRVSGNLVVAAAQVANADNIQVQGTKIGTPVVQSVNIGALNAASAAANAVNQVAADIANKQRDDARSQQSSVITVNVLGPGEGSGSTSGPPSASTYNPDSPVQVLGAGHLDSARRKALTAAEQKRLAE